MGTQSSHRLDLSQIIYLVNTRNKQIKFFKFAFSNLSSKLIKDTLETENLKCILHKYKFLKMERQRSSKDLVVDLIF